MSSSRFGRALLTVLLAYQVLLSGLGPVVPYFLVETDGSVSIPVKSYQVPSNAQDFHIGEALEAASSQSYAPWPTLFESEDPFPAGGTQTNGDLPRSPLTQNSYANITPDQTLELLAYGDAMLLDVRTEGEYRSAHIPGAKLIPVQELESRLDELDQATGVIVYCQYGLRSATAA